MKTIVIGDIHGKVLWRNILDQEQPDKVIFLGDYFDCYGEIPYSKQINNFQNILSHKRLNGDKVVLLIGNHSYHYMRGITEQYSGYTSSARIDVQEALDIALNENLIQLCHVEGKYFFSHAGLTQTYFDNNMMEGLFKTTYEIEGLEFALNDKFRRNPRAFGFQGYDPYGDDITQGCLWVRPNSLMSDPYKGYTQVQGHTKVPSITFEGDFIFCDCLDTCSNFLIIEDGIPKEGKLK